MFFPVRSSSRPSSRCSSRTSSITDSEFSEASDTMLTGTPDDHSTYPRLVSTTRRGLSRLQEQVAVNRKVPARPLKSTSNVSWSPRAVTPNVAAESRSSPRSALSGLRRRSSMTSAKTKSAECLHVTPGRPVSFPVDGTPTSVTAKLAKAVPSQADRTEVQDPAGASAGFVAGRRYRVEDATVGAECCD